MLVKCFYKFFLIAVDGYMKYEKEFTKQFKDIVNIDIHKSEKELATNILPKFLKKFGFKDTDKMFYQLALHTDTDNLHFHFSFMEKVPNYEYTKNKIDYRRTGELSQDEIDFLKAQVIHTIEKEKIYTPLLKENNKDIEKLKKYFSPKKRNYLLRDKKDLILEEKIINKLRRNKRIIERCIKIIRNDVIDSETLKQLQLLVKVSEKITDVIYLVIDNKNS